MTFEVIKILDQKIKSINSLEYIKSRSEKGIDKNIAYNEYYYFFFPLKVIISIITYCYTIMRIM